MTETKNVFISHVYKDDHGLQKLKDLLLPKGIQIRDSSSRRGLSSRCAFYEAS